LSLMSMRGEGPTLPNRPEARDDYSVSSWGLHVQLYGFF